MRFVKVSLLVVSVMLAAQLAMADSIQAFNTRPVTVNGPAPGEVSLQDLLNQIYGCTGCVNAQTDQQSAGMWGLPGTSVMSPVLQFEYAGNASSNVFGIWYTSDSSITPTMVPIFFGGATGQTMTFATIYWDAAGMHIFSPDASVNTGVFTGIPQSSFGFYLEGPGGTFYTVDQLNNGNPQAIAYNYGSLDRWTFAFEDKPYANTDHDYNDMVVSVESIAPVPEPASLCLLGSGLLGLGKIIRRKRS